MIQLELLNTTHHRICEILCGNRIKHTIWNSGKCDKSGSSVMLASVVAPVSQRYSTGNDGKIMPVESFVKFERLRSQWRQPPSLADLPGLIRQNKSLFVKTGSVFPPHCQVLLTEDSVPISCAGNFRLPKEMMPCSKSTSQSESPITVLPTAL